jgi:hypothetical protein
MATLGDNPTAEEVLEEIGFQYFCLSTIPPEADDYEEQKARINSIIDDLKEKHNIPAIAGRLDGSNVDNGEPSGESPPVPCYLVKYSGALQPLSWLRSRSLLKAAYTHNFSTNC